MCIMGYWEEGLRRSGWKSWKDEQQSVFDKSKQPRACFCIGPQNGQPLCPCQMEVRAQEREQMRKEILAEIESEKRLR